jgi:hypothetical protein
MIGLTKKLAAAGLVFAMLALTNNTPARCQQLAINVSSRNNLPPCNMDSFVYQAGAQAEAIYGDEGIHSKPPLNGFTKSSRINAGIYGVNDAGLTTGHGSYMPDAWGADEFIDSPGEWGQSGSTGNTVASNIYGTPTFTYTSPPLDPSDSDGTKGMGLTIPTVSSPKASNGLYPVHDSYGNLEGFMTLAQVILAETDQFHALLEFYNGPYYRGNRQLAPTQ